MESLWQDIRYAIRSLWKRPMFTAVAVATLALGIGANTAIFSVVDAVLLRPLEYDHPESLIDVGAPGGQDNISFPNLRDIRAQNHVFSVIGGFRYWLFNLSGKDHPQSLLGVYAGDGVFEALRVHPTVGRLFARGTESTSYPREAVISYGLWQRRFGGDPHLVGTTVVIDGLPTPIVGVLPRDFRLPDLVPASAPLPSRVPDVYLPVGIEPNNDLDQRSNQNYSVIARLAPGVTPGAATADLARVAAGLARDYPNNNPGLTLRAIPLREQLTGESRRPLTVLLGAVGLVLLIACANVGGLLLARAAERQREIGIRTALGASPFRLARQVLTESVLLALIGGVVGVLLASWGVAALRAAAPNNLPRMDEVGLNARVLLVTLVGSVITGILFGTAPVLQQRGTGPSESLRDSGRTTAGGASRLRSGLVVAEVGLAVVLLTGAGLLLRSFTLLAGVAPGFDGSNVMTMFTLMPPSRYPTDTAMASFERRALASLGALPGVESVAGINTLPLSNLGDNSSIEIVGHPVAPGQRPSVGYRVVAGPYFRTLRIRIVEGRDFGPGDTAGSAPVTIINQAAARRFFPGEDAIGHQLILGNGDSRVKTIVGIAADTHAEALDAAAKPEMSYPYTQGPDPLVSLAIRTRGDPRPMLPQFRRALAGVDPDLAFYAERTMDDLLASSLAARRFNLQLLGGFAALALALAAIGLYGVIAFSVSQRTREIGIRAALGAERSRIAALVVGEGARLGLAGLVIGVLASLLATRLLRGLLFEVQPGDPYTLAGVMVFLAAVIGAACYLPARRAVRIEPVEALRNE